MEAKNMLRRLFLIFGVVITIAGCSVPGVYMNQNDFYAPIKVHNKLIYPKISVINEKVLRTQPPYQYLVGPYDSLNVMVWNHPELTQTTSLLTSSSDMFNATQVKRQDTNSLIVVDGKGYVYFPFAGKVKVAGLTVDQVRVKLTRRLKRYIRSPQVSVQVAAFRNKEITVIGAVKHPGTLPLVDKPLSLMDAINNASGIDTTTADPGHVYVIRAVMPRTLKLPKPNIAYPRKRSKQIKIYWLSMHSPQSMLFAETFYLHPNDVVYVTSAAISDWNRVISQILPTLQTVWYTHALIR